MSNIRTFIAVQPSERVIRNVEQVIQRLQSTGAAYKWVPPQNLHVTLNFVGNVVDTEVPEFCRSFQQAIAGVPRFELSLHGVSAFPDVEQPRTIWMGVDEGTTELKALYRTIETFLSYWGVNKDRNEYVPHLTLGRIQRGGRWNSPLLDAMVRLRKHDGGSCHVDHVIVFSSFSERGAPSYTPMASVRLARS